MALASATGENAALHGGLDSVMLYTSLHTATPGTTGANELVGGTYARQANTWGSPASGSLANSASLTFAQPASTSVSYVGEYDASTAGNYSIGAALGATVTTGGTAGTLTIASGALTFGAS